MFRFQYCSRFLRNFHITLGSEHIILPQNTHSIDIDEISNNGTISLKNWAVLNRHRRILPIFIAIFRELYGKL